MEMIDEQTSSGQVSAATIAVRHQGRTSQHAFGKANGADAVFLIASLTKPMTATALMILLDRREISLSDPVQRYIPEFRGDGRELVLIKHLLTHTSGLPDMLPEDQDLRKRHAPLTELSNTHVALLYCLSRVQSCDTKVWGSFWRRTSCRV
jgi:CubicO group peptidase (beta-lactamase class C family)